LSLSLLEHCVVFNPQFVGQQLFPEDILVIAQGGYLLFLLNWPQLEPTLQGNDNIRGALIVGILRVAKTGWLSGVNNLRVNWRLSFPTIAS
jgi:hypothetical protein